MSEKRFELSEYSTVYRYSVIDNIQKGTLKANEIIILLSKQAEKIDEQQATINHLKQELKEYKENWDDLVELATKTSLRNIELDEQIGRLQRENEQLRQQLKTICNTCCYDCEEQWCENE